MCLVFLIHNSCIHIRYQNLLIRGVEGSKTMKEPVGLLVEVREAPTFVALLIQDLQLWGLSISWIKQKKENRCTRLIND